MPLIPLNPKSPIWFYKEKTSWHIANKRQALNSMGQEHHTCHSAILQTWMAEWLGTTPLGSNTQHNWPLQRSTWQLFRCSLPTASRVWWSCRIAELQWIINLQMRVMQDSPLKRKQNKRSPDAVVSRLMRSFYKDRNFGKKAHSNTLLLYIRPSESAHKGMAPPRDWSAPSFRSRWATNLCSCKELAASFSEQ